jgi:hypothetical protein
MDSWLVWQRGTAAWPPGAVAAGVLAAAGAAVVLVPGGRVAPAPGALPWLAHPAASTARHAAAASAAAERVVIILFPLEPRGTGSFRRPQSSGSCGRTTRKQDPMVLMQEVLCFLRRPEPVDVKTPPVKESLWIIQ